jgi:hypothetical protein
MPDPSIPPEARVYACPNQHRWRDESSVEAPLVNIKCPHCGLTAMRLPDPRAAKARAWSVEPPRTARFTIPPGGDDA